VPSGVSRGADTADWAMSAILVAPGHLRVGMVGAGGQPLAPGLREIAWLVFQVEAHVDEWFPDANPLAERAVYSALCAGLPTPHGVRPIGVQDSGDLRSAVSARSGDLRRAHAWLDIEPGDARAGGYTWTAVDGSVAIAVPNAWQNGVAPFDVEGDAKTAPADVLALVKSRSSATRISVVSHSERSEEARGNSGEIPFTSFEDMLRCAQDDARTGGEILRCAQDDGAACAQDDESASPEENSHRVASHLRRAAAEASAAESRDRCFRDWETELATLEPVLGDLAEDIATVWR
jgi:hypothetical protein